MANKEFSTYIPEEKAQHHWYFQNYCGAHVCSDCGLHAHVRKDGSISQELARCFCGWNLEPGERLEDDVED